VLPLSWSLAARSFGLTKLLLVTRMGWSLCLLSQQIDKASLFMRADHYSGSLQRIRRASQERLELFDLGIFFGQQLAQAINFQRHVR
jgi:hypothetical protein